MPVILPHLLSDLADNYAEQQCGFPKDKEKAREYYNKALEAGWEKETYDLFIEALDYSPLEHPQDLADDFDPRNATIMVSGHPLYLDQIEYMVVTTPVTSCTSPATMKPFSPSNLSAIPVWTKPW